MRGVAFLAGLMQLVIIGGILGVVFAVQKKGKGSGQRQSAQRFQGSKTPQVGSQARPHGETRGGARGGTHVDHDHIRSTELPHDRKLEQLKALKEAGLLTQEEYDQSLRKLMSKTAGRL